MHIPIVTNIPQILNNTTNTQGHKNSIKTCLVQPPENRLYCHFTILPYRNKKKKKKQKKKKTSKRSNKRRLLTLEERKYIPRVPPGRTTSQGNKVSPSYLPIRTRQDKR